jgi:hypothetical protein
MIASPLGDASAGAGTRPAPPGVPLTGEVTLEVRVVTSAPRLARTQVRVALAELPSVVTVLATPDYHRAQLRLTTRSLAALLTEIVRAEALGGSEVSWTPEDGLVLRLPPSAETAVAEVHAFSQAHAPLLAAETTPVVAVEPRTDAPVPAPAVAAFSERVRRTAGRLRSWWASSAGVLRLLLVPVVLTLAVAPRTMRAPSEASLGAHDAPAAGQAGVARPFATDCVAASGRQPCDAMTRALWDGDPAAWRAHAARNGEPPPDLSEIEKRTIELRLAMGDPQTRIDVAQQLGLPAMFITAAVFAETGRELDIEVEIANLGAGTAGLGGARIVDGAGESIFVLPPGASLAAGDRCHLATTPPVDTPCPFIPDAVRRPTGAGPIPLTLLGPGGEHLDALDPALP